MPWERKTEECFRFYRKIEKSEERGSFRYRDEGRAGNPTSIYPNDFCPLNKRFTQHWPLGTTVRIIAGDKRTLELIRRKAQGDGVPAGTYQFRRNYGGPGRITQFRKMQIRQLKNKMNWGWKVLTENFRV